MPMGSITGNSLQVQPIEVGKRRPSRLSMLKDGYLEKLHLHKKETSKLTFTEGPSLPRNSCVMPYDPMRHQDMVSLTRHLAFDYAKEMKPKTRLQQKIRDMWMRTNVVSILLFVILALFVTGQFYVLNNSRRVELELIAMLKRKNWESISGPFKEGPLYKANNASHKNL